MSAIKKMGAIFMDRDGTLNEEVGYLDSLDKLSIYPRAYAAVRKINESGMKSVVITNQSGIARGYFTENFLSDVHRLMEDKFREKGARIDAFYYCPHHPTEGRPPYRQICNCRKPEEGMIIAAARRLDIDLARSYLIGDTLRDIEAGVRAGARAVLVRTGYGREQEEEIFCSPARPDHVVDDILDAVDWILGKHRQ